jgi:hypothetical protein
MNNQTFTRLMVLCFAASILVLAQGVADRPEGSNDTAYRGSGRVTQ